MNVVKFEEEYRSVRFPNIIDHSLFTLFWFNSDKKLEVLLEKAGATEMTAFLEHKQPGVMQKYVTSPAIINASEKLGYKVEVFVDEIQYKAAKQSCFNKQAEIESAFRAALFQEYEVVGNPKAEQCYSIAWENGHSEGLQGVLNYFIDIVELIK